MAVKKTSGKTEQTEAKKVPAIAKSTAVGEPEKKKLPAKTKNAPKKPAAKTGKASASKKTAAKDAKVAAENFFEFDGTQIREEDIRTRIEEAYKDAGYRASAIKKLQVYYNFAERRAYYVINGKPEGLYIEF